MQTPNGLEAVRLSFLDTLTAKTTTRWNASASRSRQDVASSAEASLYALQGAGPRRGPTADGRTRCATVGEGGVGATTSATEALSFSVIHLKCQNDKNCGDNHDA